MTQGDTLVNAAIGAVINVVAGPIIPFAALVGGGVAAYLQGGNRSDGVRVGALAGLLSLIPFLLLAAVIGNVFLFVVLGEVGLPSVAGGVGVAVVAVAAVFAAVYAVVFSAIGGWLGNYVRYDTDVLGSRTGI